jgi:hypothetical protein
MNLLPDYEQLNALRVCYERMRLSYPTHQFAFAPVLIPAGDGTGEPWTETYEVHWPFYDANGTPGFMWVNAEGVVVTTEANPTPEDYFP